MNKVLERRASRLLQEQDSERKSKSAPGAASECPSIILGRKSLLGQDMSLFSFNKLFSLHSLSIYYVPERKQSVSIFKFSLKMIKKKKRKTKTIITVAECVKLTFHKHNLLMPLCNAPFHRWRHYVVCQESGRGKREWQECDGSALWAKPVTHAPPGGTFFFHSRLSQPVLPSHPQITQHYLQHRLEPQ